MTQTTTPPSPSAIDVAVGVVTRPDKRVLIAERPAGKPWSGYWEFPGGKIEQGESPRAALARELHEELGVELDETYPWITRDYAYPDRTVRLHLYRVLRWHGEARGREGQRVSWEDPRAIGVGPLLPANHPILQALNVPQVYAITHASKYGINEFMDRLRAALDKGVRLIQVRERGMTPDQLSQFARRVVAVARDHDAQVLVNGDETIARRAGADGVHLQAEQLLQCQTPPRTRLWAASCHNREELLRAAELGAHFVVLSPVLPTASHPGEPTLGWERFQELCLDMPMPVFALGGMRIDMLETAMTHSAHGVALLSGIW
jgi:8-oxo-dGTP diphosphatase